MNLASIFPSVTFATAELTEIAEAMNKPAVKKYLKTQQGLLVQDIATGLPAAGESAEEYLRKQATVVGALGAIERLLAIEAPVKSA